MSQTLHKKMKFFIKDFFSKCYQIRKKPWIWSHLLVKSSMKNFIFLQWNLSTPTASTNTVDHFNVLL